MQCRVSSVALLLGSQFYREGETEYRNWAQPEPITGQPCAALVRNETGVWRDYACTNTYSFVCSHSGSITNTTILSTLGTTTGSTTKTPTKVMLVGRVDLVPNSPSDLEDPAMLDSILQQIKAAGRIPEHSTLRWKKQKDGKVFHKKEEEEGGRGDTCH
ncbi:uncharacterized protein LOC124475285 isoform X3 [Hypomesus transpacificus]|uniref:uncharacterized protein LOC124475285 isoform X3 n=1 Tax=Hypomesus transpacificus TaxID=137520 RepID=UPI001F07917C|nr:uncharacterized protein LOC124475285 isoform X3 [Hypomesus transpacificus]